MNANYAFWTLMRRLYGLAFCVYMLLPLVIVLIVSFSADSFVQFPPESYGMRWYLSAMRNANFVGSFLFSFKIACAIAVVAGVLGLLSALALTRYAFRGRDAVIGLLTVPLALPHIVLAIALLQLFTIFAVPTSPYALFIGHLLITVPYVLRLTLTSLRGMDPQLERASQSLGATSWQTTRYVVLPNIAPGLLAGVVFSFLISFDEVTISLFTGLPGNTTLPTEIFHIASQGSDPIVTAVSGIMILLSAALVLLAEKTVGVLKMIANET